jgi:tripartite-type tricarboxylate transporter receptor subunit TctC
LTALMSGEVQVYFDVLMSSLAHLNAGKLKPLGISSKERMPMLPNVPTFAEQGIKGLEISAWFGLVAKAGTPDPLIRQLNAAMNKVVQGAAFAARAQDLGATAVGGAPDSFNAVIADETAYWRRVIKEKNIRAD